MTSLFFDLPNKKIIKHYIIKNGVRIICRDAFSNCVKLEDVCIPDSVNFIGESAFAGCIRLKEISLPNSIVYIGDYAFNCDCANAFIGGENRQIPLRINIPNSVEVIEGNPFCYNTIIHNKNKRYKVIDNVLYSANGEKLISYCSSKEEFEVPKGVKIIGKGAFRDSPITRVHFPNTLEIIEHRAFAGANKLETLIFPNSLKEIGKNAFEWCRFKTGTITLSCNIEKIAVDAFDFYLYRLPVKVIVPKGCLKKYKAFFPFNVTLIEVDI